MKKSTPARLKELRNNLKENWRWMMVDGNDKFLEALGDFVSEQENIKRENYEYPLNLIRAVMDRCWGIDDDKWDEFCEDIQTNGVDEDLQKGIDHALGMITERQRDMLLLYYRDGESFRIIGEKYGIQRERPRQIIAKAIRKLCNPKCRRYMIYGYAYASGEIEVAAKRRMAERIAKVEENLKQSIEGWENVTKHIENGETDAEQIRRIKYEMSVKTDDVSIDALGLSTRAYNILKRAGKLFASEIAEMSLKELSELRNMGQVTLAEIREQMHWAGYKLRDEE